MKKAPWNKSSTYIICQFCKKEFHISPSRLKETEKEKYGRGKYCSRACKDKSRIGKPTWNKGLKNTQEANSGSFTNNRRMWKGTQEEYMALHYWVRTNLGQPKKCEFCGVEKEGKKVHWANKSHEYKRDTNDWLRLCSKCHYEFDSTELRRQKYA